jgi:hypothetical protein
MKKLFVIAAIALVAIVVALSGCAGEKSYYLDDSDASGTCGEIITSDANVQSSLVQEGYEEGSCPSENKIGTCSYTITVEQTEVTLSTVYYSDSGITASQAESSCLAFPGATWTAAE